MKKLFFLVFLASALLPATSLARNHDGDNEGWNPGNHHGNTITATEVSEIGVAVATLLSAVVYLGMRRRAQSK